MDNQEILDIIIDSKLDAYQRYLTLLDIEDLRYEFADIIGDNFGEADDLDRDEMKDRLIDHYWNLLYDNPRIDFVAIKIKDWNWAKQHQ